MAASPAVPASALGSKDTSISHAFLAFRSGRLVPTGGGNFQPPQRGRAPCPPAWTDILRAEETLADPYDAIKPELIRQFSPNIHEQLNKIVFAPELGRQAPTQLMRSLLACLPAGEPAGLLFKHLFLLKLPGDLYDQVA